MSSRQFRVFLPAFLLIPTSLLAQLAPPGAGVRTVEIESKSVGRKLKYNIALPKGYETGNERYPVLYLLHGYSGNYTGWARLGAPQAAQEHGLIVVMPDAGNSWYANWSKSDDDQKNDWETYMVKDLIEHVDATYRTIARAREGRAINGLSMGGYGALMLGLKHPDLFCSIGSHSGAIGFARSAGERIRAGGEPTKKAGLRKLSDAPNAAIGIEGFSSQVERTPKGRLVVTADQADAIDPFKLALATPKEKLPHIYIDCGTEDGLIKSSQEFVKLLMDNKIPFTYAESDGGHNGRYWSREVGHSIAVQAEILRRSLARVGSEPAAGGR